MEEEMRKIEEEFAFQEKWIKIFKRRKFILKEVSESLILKIITKIEETTFISFLQTCKWIFILCRENRGTIMLPLDRTIKRNFCHDEKGNFKDLKELDKKFRSRFQMLLKSNFYFITDEFIYSNYLQRFSHYFQRQTIRCRKLYLKNGFCAPEAIPFFRPETVYLNGLLEPLPDDFTLPHFVKDFTAKFDKANPETLYSTLERFGWIPALFKVQIAETEQIDSGKLFPILLEVIKKRNAYNELTFLSYMDIENREFSLDYLCEEMFDNSFSNRAIISQIFVKSILGVTIITVKRRSRHNLYECEFVSISFCEKQFKLFNSSRYENNTHNTIESADEVDLKRQEAISRFFDLSFYVNLDYEAEKEKDMSQQETYFSQAAHKFLKCKKYSPPTPDPTPELVEFLKKFEDFDIQPEKMAPHKPKWKKTEKLPDLPRKLPEIHSNNWLIEAKEVIKLRKFWMDLLQKKKFILELLPDQFVLEVAKRIERRRSRLFFLSTKWVNELIQRSAPKFRFHGGSVEFSTNIYRDSPGFKEALKSLEFYYLNDISFNDFNLNINNFKEVLQWIRERKIFVKQISLGTNCPLIQEVFESFARGPQSLLISQYTTLPASVNFPPQLKEIVVDTDFLGPNRIERIEEFIEKFTGIEQAVIWLCYSHVYTNQVITHQLEALKSRRCRSNILIKSSITHYPFMVNLESQFDFSQISETVFTFRSMARGRGGVWNYFIRLEKAGSGAVGIVYYMDSIQVIDKNEMDYFEIRCDYFPTIESFLDCFEREVGSKRRARDWMQLREKDWTADPRDKDFKKFNIVMPFIHFDEQKEADDLNEVWRQFFL